MKRSNFIALMVLLMFAVAILASSCSQDNTSKTVTEPTLLGKWYMQEETQCGKNSIEFNPSNVFIENHFNNDCSIVSYNGTYQTSNNSVIINNHTKIITELTTTTLILYDSNTEMSYYYTRE